MNAHAENSGIVVDRADPRWARLRDLIIQHSLKRGDFTLSSGRKSTYIFQLRQTTMLPEGAMLIGDMIVDYMKAASIRCIGGPAVGAIPMVSAASVMSFIKGAPVDAFFVRKAAKEHGALELIDGHVRDGEEVLIVDDVATSGGSVLKALDGLKSEHASCFSRKALVVIDRQEGAMEALAQKGIGLVSIFKRSDFDI